MTPICCHACGQPLNLPVLRSTQADPGGGIPRWRCQCGQAPPWSATWGREHRADSGVRVTVN